MLDRPSNIYKHQNGIIKGINFVVEFPECCRSPNTYLYSNFEGWCKQSQNITLHFE